jgi:hypothetical protein
MLADTAGGHARPAFALVNVGKGSDIWVLEFCHAQASLRRTFINPWTSLILGIFQLALLTEREFCWAMAQLWEDAKPSAGERWRYLLDTINSWHHRMRISVYLSGSDWTERLKGYEERQNEIEDMDTFCDMTLID